MIKIKNKNTTCPSALKCEDIPKDIDNPYLNQECQYI